jgi:FlaA1/EpsC-like NDP-sugar epimerase
MEEVIMAYSNEIQITTARFANVAFSNGSLLAGYIDRIQKSQPISCPLDVKRFFVSPEESGQICMLACMLGKSGDVFFPKLEEEKMVYFKEITEDFFEAMGMKTLHPRTEEQAKLYMKERPDNKWYPVYYFQSDTSGEKLYEEFYTEKDELDMNSYQSLGVIKNAKKETLSKINETLIELKTLMRSGDYEKSEIINLLKNYIPDFEHIETGKGLDQKM